MGYEISLHLLVPKQFQNAFPDERIDRELPKEPPTCTLWRVQALLNIGRVTSMSKRELFSKLEPEQRAAFYFVDSVWLPLCQTIQSRGRLCYAPPFAIMPTPDSPATRPLAWQDAFSYGNVPGDVFVYPFSDGAYADRIPSQDLMETHNAALLANLRHDEDSDPVFTRPLTWFSCADVTSWIDLNEGSEYRKQLEKEDSRVVARFNLWRSALASMACTDSRCLFVFEEPNLPSVL